jgi:hypothetical protein
LHSAGITAPARRAGSDPGERRLEPLVALFRRPLVERQRGPVVDFGDRAAVDRRVDRLDVAKAIVCSTDVVQIASSLLERWLRDQDYASSDEARGVLARSSAADHHAWERLQYTRLLDGWKPRATAHEPPGVQHLTRADSWPQAFIPFPQGP